MKLSKEIKTKISNSLKGRIFSQNHKKNLSKAMMGKNNHQYKHGKISRFSAKRRLLLNSAYPKPENCQVCGILGIELKKGLSLDHDHKTGLFRGWICMSCNIALGMARDNPHILRSLADYLENCPK